MRLRLMTLLFLLATAAASYGQVNSLLGSDDGPLTIAWEPVEGAASYRVEIRRDGAVFIDAESKSPELKLDLSPGGYEYRISVVDPFGNQAAATAWRTLTVQRARTPYFRVNEPLSIWEGEGSHQMALTVIGINDNLVFTLEKGEVATPLEFSRNEDGGTLTVIINGLEPGEWDVRATAASGLEFVHPGAVTIRPTRPPELTGLDRTLFPAEGLVPVAISGVSFDEDMSVVFKSTDGYIEVVTVEVSDTGSAVAYLNLQGAEAGSYDIIAANPAGEETILANALSVEVPEEELAPKIQPRLDIQIGWAPMVAGVPVSGAYMFGLATFEMAFAFHSGWTKPFMNGLGVEARFLGGASTVYNENDGSVVFDYLLKADISGYWRPPVRGKVAPVFLAGFGNTWSGYALDEGNIKNMLHVRLGIGVDFATFSRFTRFGLNMDLGMTSDEPVIMVSVMFRRGFRF